MKLDFENRKLEISVSELLDFALGKIRGATPERLREGILLHRKIEKELKTRMPDLIPEKKLEFQVNIREWSVKLHGRVDAYLEGETYAEVHEIKTVIFDSADEESFDLTEYERWRFQLSIYGLMAKKSSGKTVRCFLHVIILPDRREKIFEINENIEQKLLRMLENLILNEKLHYERGKELIKYIGKLKFPYRIPRNNQVKLLQYIPAFLEEKKNILIEAPSGTGKTAAILFPVLKFALTRGLKVFYFTAKNTQQAEVLKFMKEFDKEEKIVTVQIQGKEKLCETNQQNCEDCIYAHTPSPELDLHEGHFSIDKLMDLAHRYKTCPYLLQFKYMTNAFFVVGDYNYILKDSIVFVESPKKSIIVFDEVHNLPDRVRELYSVEFSEEEFYQLEKFISFYPYVFLSQTESLIETFKEGIYSGEEIKLKNITKKLLYKFFRAYEIAISKQMGFLAAKLQEFMGKLNTLKHIIKYGPYGMVEKKGGMKYFILDTEKFFKDFNKRFYSVIGFSSTLRPPYYYLEMLGFSSKDEFVILQDEFPRENRKVVIIPEVSTLLRDREKTVDKISSIIKQLISIKKGNYIVFIPSLDYLDLFKKRLKIFGYTLLVQNAIMSHSERKKFIHKLKNSTGNLVLALSGGIFSEGVDYPGEILDGVIIISPSLPQVTEEREVLRRFYEEKYGDGFKYAYIVPGMIRVLQAAGRVIRSSDDRGIVVLIGKRFAYKEYIDLIPQHFYTESPYELISGDYLTEIKKFWSLF